MSIPRIVAALGASLWVWVIAHTIEGSFPLETGFESQGTALASHLEHKKPRLFPKPPPDPDKLHPELADIDLTRIASRKIAVDGTTLRFNLFVGDQTPYAETGPFRREALADTVAETVRAATEIALSNAPQANRAKHARRRGRPLQIAFSEPRVANKTGRFGDWTNPYVEGLCGTKKTGVASATKPTVFEGMFLWPAKDTHAHTIVAVTNWEQAMITLAHEVTHYWYARLALRDWWSVPSDALERISATSCAAKHLRWFEENDAPVDAYWRNQVFAELAEHTFAHSD